MSGKIPATATVLTFNSAAQLGRCLASLAVFEEILVLDGGSADATLDIARAHGARIEPQSDISGPIRDFTAVRERSFALAHHDWIFWLDSDEWADAELVGAIRDAVAAGDPNVAYRAERFPIVAGKTIRRAYFVPDRVLRLGHRSAVRWAGGKKVHEHLVAGEGVRLADLAGGVYTPWADLAAYRKKDRYYLNLAFSKPLDRRPPVGRTTHAVLKNLVQAMRILCYAVVLPIRYAGSEDVLPFAYHARFARYHAAVAWQRLRQFAFGPRYVPPAP
jgi:glycosyltransferase involved in cell wall biosynthesis